MLKITEYPKGRYIIACSESGDTIYNLTYEELDLIRIMIEGIRTEKIPENEVHPMFKEMFEDFGMIEREKNQ